jgi:hypothetical protein
MESLKLRHKLAFHALTASVVLNLVMGVMLDKIVSGRVAVEPSHTASIFPW